MNTKQLKPAILVTGSSGLVGSALLPVLTSAGYQVYRLVRQPPPSATDILWNPEQAGLRLPPELKFQSVIHLAGENVAARRWTSAQKVRIRESRVLGTQRLVEALLQHPYPPRDFLCASAIGYYGNRNDELLTEICPPGTGFLPDVCREWEAQSEPLRKQGTRVVHLRIGVVLSRHGGALARMLLPFRLGLGGPIGSGQQWVSWITIDDLISAIHFLLSKHELSGPVNLVTPQPCRFFEFAKMLGKVLHRPAVLPVPAWAVRLLLGEMADALLLASTRLTPDVLQQSGFSFRYPELQPALFHLLKE
ncbi:MAG: Epimerase family protein [Phycisphaerae bacterium]|nr:Epimerase family protein [Phycisphaerae bacterium]